MAERTEKNTQETTMPEEQHAEAADKAKDMQTKLAHKSVTVVPLPLPTPAEGSPRFSMPSFTKTPPTDLYKKLLPAGLFLMTFVTVMTILLIYMDTVALDAQQFRLNMTRDYELERIPQESEALVAFVRQLHLATRPPQGSAAGAPPQPPQPTRTVRALDTLYGQIYNGTFVEFLPSGPREPTTRYLEGERGWRGVAARGAAVDYLALRGAARVLHACLSPTPHPREVTYHESAGGSGSAFSSRVLCLPLYTVLAAGGALRAHYTLLAGAAVYPALTHLPFDKVHLQTIEVRASDLVSSYKITKFLESKNYTIAETFEDGILYALKDY